MNRPGLHQARAVARAAAGGSGGGGSRDAGSRPPAGSPAPDVLPATPGAAAGVPAEIIALGPWLEAHVPGFGILSSVAPVGRGQSNPTYLLDTDAGRFVLRTQPPGPLLKGAHLVNREFRVMEALAGSGVPVPRVLRLSDATGPLGRMFFVMEWVAGTVHWDPALPDEPRERRVLVYRNMAHALAGLHRIDPMAVGLGDFGRHSHYYARQLSTWTRAWEASRDAVHPDVEALIAWLNAHLPADDATAPVSLVHGDWRIDNLIFDTDSGAVRAILDWELATLGRPEADLAYQCAQWRLPHDGAFKGLGGIDRAALGLPDETAYVASYCAAMGIEELPNWRYALAFGLFRLAAILQGVQRRWLDGNAANAEKAALYGRAVPLVARLAREVID